MCLECGVSAGVASLRIVEAMGRSLIRYLCSSAVVLGFSLLWALSPANASQSLSSHAPHDHFQNPEACPKCHVFAEGVLAPDRFLPDSDGFCLGCHRKESLGRSHPVNVGRREKSPTMKIPGAFRLGSDGRLLCLTCHAAHEPYLSANPSFPGQAPFTSEDGARTGYKTYYLRRTSPKDGFAALCMACHGIP